MSFSFGAPSSAPATSSLAGGFSFAANKPAAPGFGLSATSQASTGLFGSTPATAAPAFGTTTPAFGTTTPAFGANTSFGNNTTTGFGAAATPGFGAAATPAFGAAATPAFGATSTAPAFGSTPAFGTTTSAPAFGATTAPTFGATTTPGFGTGLTTGGLNFGAGTNTSAPAAGLTLGAPTATTSAGLGGLGGFGLGTTAANTGMFGTASTANTSTGLFGAKLGTITTMAGGTLTSAAPSLGLGGVAPSGVNSAIGDGKAEPPKQMKLPNEIQLTVDSFKEFVNKQKSISSEIMRISIKPLHKVSREAESTLRMALSLSGEVGRARAHSRRLRACAAAALAKAESITNMPGAELECSAPPAYVKELISELEQQMVAFRRQMDVADKQMQSSPKLLTEQELTLGIRRMYESLVALAGRLQAVHTQVQAQKEQYLNMRKYILKDPTNVFETPSPMSSLDQILREVENSRKKSKSNHLGASASSAVLTDPRVALGNIQQLAGPSPFSYIGSTLSPYSNTEPAGQSWQPQPQSTTLNTSFNTSFAPQTAESSSSFQLQKPPGKRCKQ